MDIVLGVSMSPTTVRMVLVEGEKADGKTVDHDVFDINSVDGSANSSPSDQVISAILGTQQSAVAGGHRLITTGVTWSDHDEAAALRDALAARGIEDVMLVSQLHAAGALAQAVGRAVGYDTTALMFIDRDAATLSVVETRDGSIVKVDTRSLHSADAMAVMTDMVTGLDTPHSRPGGLFVIGSGVDVTSVKEHLEHLVSLPVSAPEDAEMALARGAAIAAAAAPRFEASTVGLAYSQDPDPAFAATQLRAVSAAAPAAVDEDDAMVADDSRRPFLLVGSTMTSIFVIGVVALVISLAVSIRPTVDQRPNPGENNVVVPSIAAPAPPEVEPAPAAPAPVQPPPETIQAPVPVVQEAPQQPRPVFVEAAPQAPAPAPAAPAPAVLPPAPEVLPPAPAAPAPVIAPPVIAPPIFLPPIINLPFPQPTYYPPRPTYYPPPPTWTPPKPTWTPPRPTWTPPVPTWTPPVPTWTPPRPTWTPPVPEDPPWTPPQQPAWTPPQQPAWTPPQQQPQQPQQPIVQVPLPTITIPQPQQPRQQERGPSNRGPSIPYWPYSPGR